MQLEVHGYQGLLHGLDVSRGIRHHALAMPQGHPQSRPRLSRMETASK
jgi:hypothetical protein